MGRKLPGRGLSRRFSGNSSEHDKYYLPLPQQKFWAFNVDPTLPYVFDV
jgi:hypothetical protein